MIGNRIIPVIAFLLVINQSLAQNFSKVPVVAFETMADAHASWADFDNDGYPDLFVTGTNAVDASKVLIYFNNGDDTFNTLNIVEWSEVAFAFGDYDLDGYLDILLSGEDSDGDRHFEVYENNGSGSFTTQSFGLKNISRGGVQWADFDRDGDLDIVASGLDDTSEETVVFYEFDQGAYAEVSLSTEAIALGQVDVFDADNDGTFEVLFTGLNDSGNATSIVYSLNQNWELTLYSNTTEGYGVNGTSLADYNEDGYLDLAMTGYTETTAESSDLFSNNGASFTQISSFLQGVSSSSLEFADLNNDGLQDILLCGLNGSTFYFQYYQNAESAGAYSFSTQSHGMENIFEGDMAVADYDLDGDLDVFQIGNSDLALQANLFSSDASIGVSNASPNVPGIVSAVSKGDSVTLEWSSVTDDLTNANSITYNYYMSNNSSGDDLVVSPHSDISTGYRRSGTLGNAGFRTTEQVNNLPEGNYYWSVQALDGQNKGSAFSTEEEFAVCYAVDIGNDTTICLNESITISVTDPEADEVNWYSKIDGLLVSDALSYEHTATKQDTIIAEVTKTFGCVRYDTLVIKIYDLPIFNLGADTTICYGEEWELSVSDLGIIDLDSVNWYSEDLGELDRDSENLIYEILEKDTIIVEVFNVNGCVNNDSLVVEAYDLPDFSLGSDLTICFEEFYDLSVSDLGITDLDSVNWYSTNTGVLLKDSETLSYEVLAEDDLVAEVFNVNGCVNYDTINVSVYSLPNFELGSDTTICYGETLEVTVSDLGISGLDKVNWYSELSGLLVEDSEDLNYEVLVEDEIIAEVFSTTSCVSYDTIKVSVYDLPDYNIGSDTTICFGEYLNLSVTDLGIVGLDSVNWYSMDQGTLELNNENLSYEVLEKDTLIAEVFNLNGCVNYDSLVVSVYDLPDYSIGNDTTICYGEYFDLSVTDLGIVGLDSVNWYSMDQGTLELNSEDLSYEVLEKDTLIAEVFNINGCVNYDSLVVSVYNLPDYSIGNDTTICYGEYFDLSVTDLGIVGLDSVNWYSMDQGTLELNSEDLSYEVLEKDTLIVEVFNVNGCVNYDSLVVSVYDLPDYYIGNDTTICFGEYLDLSVTDLGIMGLDSVNWYSMDQGTLELNSEDLSYEVLEKDTLISEVFNVNGCVNYDSLVVSVYDLPDYSIGHDTTICYGESFGLSVSDLDIVGLDNANWYSTVSGLLLADSENLNYQVLSQDTIVAEVFNVNGCVNYDSLVVSVYDLPDFYLGNDTTICYGEYFDFSVSELGIVGLDSVNWYSTGLGILLNDSEDLSYELLEKDTIIVEVFNVNGCVNYDSLVISMYDLPVFNIGSDTSICYGSSILLQTGVLYDEVNWYALLNSETLALDSWFYDFTSLVSDTIVAEVYDVNRCLNYDTISIVTNPLPDYTIGEDQNICSVDSAYLEVSGSWAEVNWYTFSDQVLQLDNPAYDFKVEETVTLWSEVFSDKGCVAYDTISVTELPLPEFDFPEEEMYCYGDAISLQVELGSHFEWRGEEGLLSSTSSWETLAVKSDLVSLYIEDENECRFSDTLTVIVNSLPEYEIEGMPEMCLNDSTVLTIDYLSIDSIHWYSQTESLVINEISLTFSQDETTWIYADLIDLNQCLSTDSVEVVVHELPQALAGPDSLICSKTNVQLGDDDTESDWVYNWSPSETLDDINGNRPIAFPSIETTYYLQVVNEEGCQAFDTVTVGVNPPIILSAGADVSICLGDETELGSERTASGSLFDYEYLWTSSAPIADPASSNPIVSPATTSDYILKVTSAYCPEEYDTVTVVVNYAPEITVSPQQSVGADESVVLEATGGEEYIWSPDNSLDDPFIATPEASPLETTTYTVLVTDTNGCENTGEITVLVQNVLFIPNLFTPNGDFNNDSFMVYGSGIESITFQVFDLSGNKLYETSDVAEATIRGWDGSYRGKTMANGTYLWSISGEYHDGSSLKFRGQTKGTIKLMK